MEGCTEKERRRGSDGMESVNEGSRAEDVKGGGGE